MPAFYKIHSPSVSHREYWWGNRSPLVLLAWLLKWLRVPIPGSSDDANCESILPFTVPALPPEVSAHFEPVAQELASLGFVEPVFHVIQDPSTSTTMYWATYRHTSGQHLARIHQRFWHQTKKADRGMFVLFITPFADGTFAVSSSGKPDMDSPPTVPMLRKPNAGAHELWSAHQVFATQRGQGIHSVHTSEESLHASERLHILQRDFHLARGVFRRRSAKEQAEAEALATHVAGLQGAGVENAGVLGELERLQTQKPGWGNAIVILLVSAAAFFAAGSAQFDWKFTLWIIPILLFHEAGHWIAMRVFGYRNLRMFFIPFFGAAVSGRNWNVPGWKKALVSLAGPVPGIFLGAALAVVAIITSNEYLNKAALLLLLLNGFNLLPVLPLDGGHVLHATLFCRNRWLDFGFRIAAVAALVLLSLMPGGKITLYLAILFGIGLPVAFKIGKVIEKLQSAPPPFYPQTSDDRIPLPVAQSIISALKTELPAATGNKVLAQHTINVYETLNAKPPEVFGTFALLGLHGFSFCVALVFGIALMVAQHGGFSFLAGDFGAKPKIKLACGTARKIGTGANNVLTHMMVVTALRQADAENAYRRFAGRVPSGGKLSLIGSSLLLSFPATNNEARETWFTQFSNVSSNTFVVLSNRTLSISFTCVARDTVTASNVTRELNEYFRVAHIGDLAPPWSPEMVSTNFDAARTARRTWVRIDDTINSVWTNADSNSLLKQANSATRRGDLGEADRLRQLQARQVKDAQTNLYRKLAGDGHDAELVELHQQLAALGYTNRVERPLLQRRVANRLGRAEGAAVNFSANYGILLPAKQFLRVSFVTFQDAQIGWPAFVDWLCAQGCSDIRYHIFPVNSDYADDFDEER